MHPGPEQHHYRRRRDHGDNHIAALRHLLNRMLGQLHHCLQHHQLFDDRLAYTEYTHHEWIPEPIDMGQSVTA